MQTSHVDTTSALHRRLEVNLTHPFGAASMAQRLRRPMSPRSPYTERCTVGISMSVLKESQVRRRRRACRMWCSVGLLLQLRLAPHTMSERRRTSSCFGTKSMGPSQH